MDLNIAQKRRRQVESPSVTSTKRNHKRKRTYIPRRTRKFQLRTTHAEDMHVAEILDYARSERREVTMIRAAIQLQHSLEQGDPSILFERFPWIIEAVKAMVGGGGGELSEIKSMLEMVMAQQKSNNGYQMTSQPATTGRPLTSKQLTAPSFADDEDDVLPIATKANANAGSDACANFLRGLQMIQ